MEPCARMFAAAKGPSVVGSSEPSGAPNATPASFDIAISATAMNSTPAVCPTARANRAEPSSPLISSRNPVMKTMSEPSETRPMRLRVSTFCSGGGPVCVKYRMTIAIVVANTAMPAKAVALRTPVPTKSPCSVWGI